jgi:FtsH-binding integral membrane protein
MRIHPTLPVATRQEWLNQLRVVGAILLLGAIWYTLFIWGVRLTEQWLTWSQQTLDGTPAWLSLFLHLPASWSSYLPAWLLVWINQALFFYRLPRVEQRLVIPVEFALTTLSFVGIQLLLLQLSQDLAEALPWFYEGTLLITLLLLALLFWVQGSGALHGFWSTRAHKSKSSLSDS